MGGAEVVFSNISSVNLNSTYFWDFDNDGNIDSTDPNPIHIFEYPGNYVVTLEVLDGCTGETNFISYEIIIDSTVGESIDTSDQTNLISIYPNPSENSFYISNRDFTSNLFLDLMDSSGRIIKSDIIKSAVQKVSVIDIFPGVYYVYIRNNDGLVYYEKVIVL